MTSANVGAVDRILRIILGGVLVAAPFFVGALELPSIPGIAALAVGAILIITAMVKFCPIYSVFGFRTRS
ncbi:MAG: DUF2892 domain-containing protein [Pseudomonadota bacterium]